MVAPTTTIRVVLRIPLPVDQYGRLSAAPLRGMGEVMYPPGSTVEVECGRGTWMPRHEVRELARELRHCGHISLTGAPDKPFRPYDDGSVVVGLEAIGHALDFFLSASPLSVEEAA